MCQEVVIHSNYPRNLNNIVKSINNRCGLGQRKIAQRFKAHYSTISRNLGRRTSIVIRKHSKAPRIEIVNNNKFEQGKPVVSYTENY